MNIRRSIDTKIWGDAWFENLQPTQKLLWIYLLTNSNTNMLGIYEISIKRVAYETGITADDVISILKYFEEAHKAFFWHQQIFIPNWIKNQAMNPNMVKSAKNEYDSLSDAMKDSLKDNGFESFESLSKGWVRVHKVSSSIEKDSSARRNGSEDQVKTPEMVPKIEKEKEEKREAEKESKTEILARSEEHVSILLSPSSLSSLTNVGEFVPPTKEEVRFYFSENGYDPEKASYAWLLYKGLNWQNKKGIPITDWKQEIKSEYFIPENNLKTKKVFGR